MIRVKRSKPVTVGTRTSAKCVTMRFTGDRDATGLVMKPLEVENCDCSEGFLQTLPEWEYMLNDDGERYNCNIANTLEMGSFKVDEGGKSFKNGYYIITAAGSFIYYLENEGYYYAVATNRVKVAPFFVKTYAGPRIALCTRKGFLLADTKGKYETIIEDETLSAGALYRHRIFLGMVGGVVKYSAPEEFTNFNESVDEGGEIAFPHCGGEIIAMKTYEDALYIFFRSGIMRLKAGGEPSGFYSEELDYTGGDIFPRTICVCQHSIYFLARSGLYRLKGKKTERLDIKADFPTEETGLEGNAVWKDRPMIRYQKADGAFETIIVGKDGKSAFFMSGLDSLGRGEDGRVLFIDKLKYLCQLTDKGTYFFDGRFCAAETDFGCPGKKRLERLRFSGEGNFSLSILYNGMSMGKSLEFENGVAEWKFNRAEAGEKYQMTFELGRGCKITSMQAEFKVFS